MWTLSCLASNLLSICTLSVRNTPPSSVLHRLTHPTPFCNKLNMTRGAQLSLWPFLPLHSFIRQPLPYYSIFFSQHFKLFAPQLKFIAYSCQHSGFSNDRGKAEKHQEFATCMPPPGISIPQSQVLTTRNPNRMVAQLQKLGV